MLADRARATPRHAQRPIDRPLPDLAAALAALPARNALLDCEVVVFDREGRTRFQALQGALGRKRPAGVAVQFAAFDCLYLDERDVREARLLERKQLLRALLSRQPQVSRTS
jgi:bifunctional non-homologous end joining protein LigD